MKNPPPIVEEEEGDGKGNLRSRLGTAGRVEVGWRSYTFLRHNQKRKNYPLLCNSFVLLHIVLRSCTFQIHREDKRHDRRD